MNSNFSIFNISQNLPQDMTSQNELFATPSLMYESDDSMEVQEEEQSAYLLTLFSPIKSTYPDDPDHECLGEAALGSPSSI